MRRALLWWACKLFGHVQNGTNGLYVREFGPSWRKSDYP